MQIHKHAPNHPHGDMHGNVGEMHQTEILKVNKSKSNKLTSSETETPFH